MPQGRTLGDGLLPHRARPQLSRDSARCVTSSPETCDARQHDASTGFTCPDGSTGPADLLYSFDPVSLAGTVSYTSKPGVCNDPNSQQGQQPISLQPA